MIMNYLNRIVLLAAALAAAVLGVSSAASAAAIQAAGPAAVAIGPFTNLMAGQPFLIKENDLAVIGGKGTYQWVACGISTDPFNVAEVLPCAPGQDRIYASFYTLRYDTNHHKLVSGDTIIFDQEGWSITPAYEREHPQEFLQRAAQLAAASGVTIIETPTGATPGHTGVQQQALDVTAAAYAPVIELQDQYLDGNPAAYIATVKVNVAAVRAVSKTVVILAGLAPDAGGRPVTSADMLDEYQSVRSIVQGFWLNADQWAPPKGTGCAPAGCPLVVDQFITDITG